ncbi:hypothetical protein ACFE33_13470 [Falsihalocynthiibacter sp. SS001]|uniref:hypothetical protein n=1 Tax=Falsihalocynthiibacter sp. SS001 TaxID=3349698 RepID=UPI0036D26047
MRAITVSKLTAFACALVVLAGCATQQERCVNSATRDLRTVTGLVAETQANIARGFGYNVQRVPYTVYETCYYAARRAYACPQTYTRTISTPVAIDIQEEKRKLASLQQRKTELESQVSEWIAQCRLKYPE